MKTVGAVAVAMVALASLVTTGPLGRASTVAAIDPRCQFPNIPTQCDNRFCKTLQECVGCLMMFPGVTEKQAKEACLPLFPEYASVGGIVELRVDSGDSVAGLTNSPDAAPPPYAVIAGAGAVAALALTASAWHTRRRFSRG